MNAGGHGDDTASSLVSAEVVDLGDGRLTERPTVDRSASPTGARTSVRDEVVTAAPRSASCAATAAASKAQLAEIVRWRREHQPGGSNAGSIFANPADDHAGRLVEAAGAKGRRLGTAAVSEKHANFIQADPGGRADDVAALIDEVRALVEKESGVALETEVVLVGFEATR